MKHIVHLMAAVLAIGSCLFAGCGRRQVASSGDSRATNQIQPNGWQSETNTDPWAQAMRKADKIYQEKLRNPPTNREVPLPNYQAGPLNPRPAHVNFYAIDDRYPAYLLCQYDNVDEQNYDQSKEAKRFKASLE